MKFRFTRGSAQRLAAPVEVEWDYCQTCGSPLTENFGQTEPICRVCKPMNDAATHRVQRDFQAAQGAGWVRACYQFDVKTGQRLSR